MDEAWHGEDSSPRGLGDMWGEGESPLPRGVGRSRALGAGNEAEAWHGEDSSRRQLALSSGGIGTSGTDVLLRQSSNKENEWKEDEKQIHLHFNIRSVGVLMPRNRGKSPNSRRVAPTRHHHRQKLRLS